MINQPVYFWRVLIYFAFLLPMSSFAVLDDLGQNFTNLAPANRIITLTPNATELMYAIGAGDKLVAAVEYADYPEAAKALPRVGNYAALAIESIVALKPDLVVYWPDGNPKRDIARLKSLGVPLFASNPNDFAEIVSAIKQFGQLTGQEQQAERLASEFWQEILFYRGQYQKKPKVRVFYQVWSDPILTQNGNSFISKTIELCGGENIFANLPLLAPQVSKEAVLAHNPEIIITGRNQGVAPSWLQDWQRFKELKAVRNQQLKTIDSDLIHQPTPRLIQGVQAMCQLLDDVRRQRG